MPKRVNPKCPSRQSRQASPRIAVTSLTLIAVLSLAGCRMGLSAGAGYVATAPELALTRVRDEPGIPSWSPDGERIAWGSEDGLVVADVGGQERTILSTRPLSGRPAWSPDGKALAFVDGAQKLLVIVDLKAGAELPVTTLGLGEAGRGSAASVILGGPSWSPDGTRLAFVCWDGAGDEVCTVHRDGSSKRPVTRLEPTDSAGNGLAASNAGPPAWSPDGKRLAVAAYAERRNAPAGVFIINLDDSTSTRISKALPNSEIIWANDGQSVLFSATNKGRSDVWQVDVASLEATNLSVSQPAGGRNPAVAAAGEQIAFESGLKIVVIRDAESAGEVHIPGQRAKWPAWSPDGERLAIAGIEDPIQTYD